MNRNTVLALYIAMLPGTALAQIPENAPGQAPIDASPLSSPVEAPASGVAGLANTERQAFKDDLSRQMMPRFTTEMPVYMQGWIAEHPGATREQAAREMLDHAWILGTRVAPGLDAQVRVHMQQWYMSRGIVTPMG